MSEKFPSDLNKNPELIPAILFGVIVAVFFPTPYDFYSALFVKAIVTLTAFLIGYVFGKIIFKNTGYEKFCKFRFTIFLKHKEMN